MVEGSSPFAGAFFIINLYKILIWMDIYINKTFKLKLNGENDSINTNKLSYLFNLL